MKKLSFLILFVGVILAGFLYRYLSAPEASSGIPTPTIVAQTEYATKFGLPVKLEIPNINVASSVEYVGLDSKRNMDVPKEAANVGWYNLGPKPGEMGSAVMAGHLDDPSGAPAVFWNLKKLKIGDEINVTDENGEELTFRVTKIETFPFDEFPLEEVFADTSGKYLNLITCEGEFDKATKNYAERTVVYSEIVD